MDTDRLQEVRFNQKVSAALGRIRTILDNERQPTKAEDVQHQYADKYALAEFLANAALATQLNILDDLGLSAEGAQKVKGWSKTRAVTLRFKVEEKCAFDREETRKVESDTQHVTEVSGMFGKAKVVDKVVRRVTEYFYKYEVTYEVFAYAGTDDADKVVLAGRTAKYEVKRAEKRHPRPESTADGSCELNLTWLLQNLSDDLSLCFAIDREAETCRTPRRNQPVSRALDFVERCYRWCARVRSFFTGTLFPLQAEHGLDLSAMTQIDSVFIPVVPLMEQSKADAGEPAVLSPADLNAFLAEQRRALVECNARLAKVYPTKGKLITAAEARVVALASHWMEVCESFSDGVNYIEDMLRKQLIKAIGKEIGAAEFSEYMTFHNRKLFKEDVAPKLFSYAVRRPDRSPEGSVTIEQQQLLADAELPQPTATLVRKSASTAPVRMQLNATTCVSFTGDKFVHGWMSHQFSGTSGSRLTLVARARQFSCFMLMVGRMADGTTFQPLDAIILQNKDELRIPLDLEVIPSAKEFAAKTKSLSPEQLRFAKAIRAMQLEGSLFALVVVQIKPQIERLLRLPDDSLTKEIELTQDLLDLFIKYQIPSDQLSYSGPEDASTDAKVEQVRKYVAQMHAMIQQLKEEQLQQAQLKHLFRKEDNSRRRDMIKCEDISESDDDCDGYGAWNDDCDEVACAALEDEVDLRRCDDDGDSDDASIEEEEEEEEADEEEEPTEEDNENDDDDEAKGTKEYEQDEDAAGEDFTQVPVQLDGNLGRLDPDGAVRPTIIRGSDAWTRISQKTLLSDPVHEALSSDRRTVEKNSAFDVLESITRSGLIPVGSGQLHVVVGATHAFDKTLVNTVLQDNVNPIEKVERSMLILGMTVHQQPPRSLVNPGEVERVSTYSPEVMAEESAQEQQQ